MDNPQPTYLVYLLRLRRVDNGGQPVWRISLEAPGSETQIYCENLEALCTYLAAQMRTIDREISTSGEEGGDVYWEKGLPS